MLVAHRLWGRRVTGVPAAGGLPSQAYQLGERILILWPVRRRFARDHVLQRGHADREAIHDVLACSADQIGIARRESSG